MSRTINALKAAQQGITPSLKNDLAQQAQVTLIAAQRPRLGVSWVVVVFLILVFMAILVLNMKLFMAYKTNSLTMDNTLLKVKNMEETLNYNASLIETFSTGMQKLDSSIAATNLKLENNSGAVSQLEQTNEEQKTAIENLTKAKDVLFNRLSTLEAKAAETKN